MTPILIKLGTLKAFGFYTPDVTKKYTTIQRGKMACNVLEILCKDQFSILMGLYFGQISDALLDLQPDLAVDDFGQSTTLNMLLKDFNTAGLLDWKYNNGSSKVVITDLGQEFLKRNVT